jgi:hypothetical protein
MRPLSLLRSHLLPLLAIASLAPAPAAAFCGFYVARADTALFNRASQVVLVREGDRTVITMANDFRGDLAEFAIVIPVPTFLEREQIHVADKALIDHLDAYTSPRLVEYFDDDPCRRWELERLAMADARAMPAAPTSRREKGLGVTVEASYTVGEYDIQILSAEQSSGLTVWLRQEGYRLPDGAEAILGSYLKQGMRFFVAKVNLDEQAALGFTYLRPLQIAFESRKFMLPIRLGTLNADGPQELFVYTLTRTGRVETTNYRTVRLPTDMDLPAFVKDEFGDFYRAMFTTQVERERLRAVFLEYAWDMAWCDPCAADPLSPAELRQLGVFWVGGPAPQPDRSMAPQAADVFVTRLHLRYDAQSFPEDLHFQETGDRANFQGRYVLRHAFKGEASCEAAEAYFASLPERWAQEAETLASLTGWDVADIRGRMDVAWVAEEAKPWWRRLWE